MGLEGIILGTHALKVRGVAADLDSDLLEARLGTLGHGVHERGEGRGGDGGRSRRGGGVGRGGEGGRREGRGCSEDEDVTEGHCEYENENVVQRSVLVRLGR